MSFLLQEEPNIFHTFYECHTSKTFWEMLCKWLNNTNTCLLHFTRNDILFGLIPYKITTHSINHILMYAKYYIHMKKKSQQIIHFETFLAYYKNILIIEKEIYCQNDDLKSFNAIFGNLTTNMQNYAYFSLGVYFSMQGCRLNTQNF